MRWIIRNQIADRVRPAWFGLRNITVRPASDPLLEEIRLRGGELQARYRDPAEALPAFTPARRMYHALGLDPSKTRPSSEALVRRILQGKGLYRVNSAVDAANLASITIFRSIGLYDADWIRPESPGEGPVNGPSPPVVRAGLPGAVGNGPGTPAGVVILRLGRTGEEYAGIGKETVHLGGRPALFDLVGPFGNPSSDSDRTKVTLETRRLLFVLFEPSDEAPEAIEKRLAACRQIMLRHVGGELED